MAISESRIIENRQSIVDINLPDYSYEFCPTESFAGGILLYMRNHAFTKDQRINKSCELESNLIESSNSKKANIVIGCIYKLPGMKRNGFNELYLNDLLDKRK